MNITYRILRINSLLLIPAFLWAFSSCKKFISVPAPVTSINGANVFSDDATAIAAVTGIYTTMSSNNFSSGGTATISSLSLLPGLSADELTLYDAQVNTNAIKYYYINQLTGLNVVSPDFWTVFYNTIFAANSSIQGLNNATTLTPAVKQQLLGESEFIRAFSYFYLVNLYGDVPLTLSTDFKANSLLPRTAKFLVLQQVITDLKNAQALLNTNYLDATLLNTSAERVRPTKWVATALLARVYLYNNDWTDAEIQSGAIISNSSQYSLDSLNRVFLKNSNEAIWQLQPVQAGENTPDAWMFVIPQTGPNGGLNPVFLSSSLLKGFEPGDGRRINWVDSVAVANTTYYYPFKYKSATFGNPVTEYEMIFRLAEQYLIRAEARIELGAGNAVGDLNVIRARAGLANYAGGTDKTSLVAAILHERQVELFTEWGHRWFDLKRTNNINNVMNIVCPQKGGTWNSDWQLYPILIGEIKADPNLKQNPGY